VISSLVTRDVQNKLPEKNKILIVARASSYCMKYLEQTEFMPSKVIEEGIH
jgi:hypothetical protein